MDLKEKIGLRYLYIILILALITLNPYCNSKNVGQDSKKIEKKVIKLSHCHQPSFSSEIHTAAWIFQKWIEDNSNTLAVKIYPSSSLGQEREVYEAMQLGGGASCIISGTAILSNFVPQIGILDLPFLWKDYKHIHRTLDGQVGNELETKLLESGFRVIAWMDSWGYRNIVTADDPIRNIDDLKGLKIRTIQSPTYIAALNMMGVNATPLAFGEVYTAMQTGVLDGFEHNATVVKANKLYEVADHMALTQHLFGPLVMIFSEKEWKSYSAKEREVIRQGAKFARDVQRSLAPIREKEAIRFLEKKGMQIHSINRGPFLKEAEKLQNKFAKKYNAQTLLNKIRKPN